MTIKCEVCGKEYRINQSILNRAEHHFCSKACYGVFMSRDDVYAKCDMCGDTYKICKSHFGRTKTHFCSKECFYKYKRTQEERDRVSALGIGKQKYKHRNRQSEHRYIVEQKIGRKLKSDEIVHHIDGNKRNNDPSNLTIMSRAEHAKLHARMRAAAKGGDAK